MIMSRFDFNGRVYRGTSKRISSEKIYEPTTAQERRVQMHECFNELKRELTFAFAQYHDSSITASLNPGCNLKVSIYNMALRIEVDRKVNGAWESSVYSDVESVIKDLK